MLFQEPFRAVSSHTTFISLRAMTFILVRERDRLTAARYTREFVTERLV